MPAGKHLRKTCPGCLKEFRSDRFKTHLPKCDLKLVKCIWGCGDKLHYKEYKKHEKKCKDYALKECEKFLKKIKIQEGICRHCHLKTGFPHFEATCKHRMLRCFRCRGGFKAVQIKQHVADCKKINTFYSKKLRRFVRPREEINKVMNSL